MKTGQNYLSELFDVKIIINNVMSNTIDITYINRPGSVYERSIRRQRDNKNDIESYLLAGEFILIE